MFELTKILIISVFSCMVFLQCKETDPYDPKNFEYYSLKYFPNTFIVSDSFFLSKRDANLIFVKAYYKDGSITAQYYLRNGKLDGIFKTYGINEKTFVIIEYKDGKKINEKIFKDN